MPPGAKSIPRPHLHTPSPCSLLPLPSTQEKANHRKSETVHKAHAHRPPSSRAYRQRLAGTALSGLCRLSAHTPMRVRFWWSRNLSTTKKSHCDTSIHHDRCTHKVPSAVSPLNTPAGKDPIWLKWRPLQGTGSDAAALESAHQHNKPHTPNNTHPSHHSSRSHASPCPINTKTTPPHTIPLPSPIPPSLTQKQKAILRKGKQHINDKRRDPPAPARIASDWQARR
jgi:hypothetical protein